VSPGGRGTVSPSVVTLRHDQSVTVHVTPGGVSQRIWDGALVATINGISTPIAGLTSVGVVLPNHVRALDTPEQMVDRISLGDSHWGSYRGVGRVTPNLMNVYGVDFSIQRPAEDDTYGNAAVNSTDNSRLRIATQSVLRVAGTAQTEPGEQGQTTNAPQLRLAAGFLQSGALVSLVATHGLAVAAIPVVAINTTLVR